MKKEIEELFDMLRCSITPYHTVEAAGRRLKEAGLEELYLEEPWALERGRGYFIKPYGSSLIGFWIGEQYSSDTEKRKANMLRIGAAHTDYPCMKIKPCPEKNGSYQQINVEVYGGPILNTWLDRPLSAAGRVSINSADVFQPEKRLVDLKKPLFVIPNLAIHMNRKVNEGVELNRQIDMLPIAAAGKENSDGWFLDCLSKELKVRPEDILDYELYLYNLDGCESFGLQQDLICAPRLDNITSVQACISALIEGKRKTGINVIALFDNEEVGSKTKQGGDSQILPMVLERIYLALRAGREEYLAAIAGGMMLSADVAHAIHPNHPEKCDITNQIVLNEGVALKLSGTQRYATDSEAVGIVEQICKKRGISYKKFANRSDIAGGSTLGSLTSSILPMKTVDIGIPILAMHSARETMGANDQGNLCELIKAFFEL